MEIRRKNLDNIPVKAVVLDFDGTLSTLRSGWEQVMRDMMVEYLGENDAENITQYIERSAGIQTIHQMKWLKDRVQEKTGKSLDAWDYKDEYNRRLMLDVDRKKAQLAAGQAERESFLMAGAVPFLKALRQLGVHLHVASGTDQEDVIKEAELLGVSALVDSISGAPYRAENCSKEKVLGDLIARKGLHGPQVCVIGDGRVEIALGVQMGARTLGLASDEIKREGINPVKRGRLVEADAEAIVGDFLAWETLLGWMNLKGQPS